MIVAAVVVVVVVVGEPRFVDEVGRAHPIVVAEVGVARGGVDSYSHFDCWVGGYSIR